MQGAIIEIHSSSWMPHNCVLLMIVDIEPFRIGSKYLGNRKWISFVSPTAAMLFCNIALSQPLFPIFSVVCTLVFCALPGCCSDYSLTGLKIITERITI